VVVPDAPAPYKSGDLLECRPTCIVKAPGACSRCFRSGRFMFSVRRHDTAVAVQTARNMNLTRLWLRHRRAKRHHEVQRRRDTAACVPIRTMYSMSSTTKSHACNDHSVLRGSAMLYDQDNCVRLQSLHAININRAVTDCTCVITSGGEYW